MLVSARQYFTPKAGCTDEEYEDAFYPSDSVDAEKESFSFAVADGATETSYSKMWAQLLVEGYCNGRLTEPNPAEEILSLQSEWSKMVGSRPLPWYAEEKIRSGAFSSLLGLTIKQGHSLPAAVEGTWEATAIGDSCLFQIRDDELLRTFPLENSEQFNSRPVLISSNPTYNGNLEEHILNSEGHWQAEDDFYLLTDALACWFFKEVEKDRKPWKFKYAQDMFVNRINNLRKKGTLRNDDVTMIHVEILSADSLE